MQNYTDLTFILDRSGSMANIMPTMIQKFGEFVQKEKQTNPNTKVTFVTFSSSVTTEFNNKDISEVLASKGIERFVAIGWSGGGPHALANTLLDTNVGAITLAGVGAFGVDDLDFLEGMAQENHDEFGASLQGEDVIQKWFVDNATAFKSSFVFVELINPVYPSIEPDAYFKEEPSLESGFSEIHSGTFK